MFRFQMSSVVALSLVVLLLAGCGGPKSVKVTPVTVSAADAVKGALNDIVQSGELGSGSMALQENIEKLKATDAAKGEALLKDYEALAKLKDPAALKAKAKEMLGKL